MKISASEFTEKYKDYLIGKKVRMTKSKNEKDNGDFDIKNVLNDGDSVLVIIETNDGLERFNLNDLDGFINGEKDDSNSWGDFELVIQKNNSELEMTTSQQIKWLEIFIDDRNKLDGEYDVFYNESISEVEYSNFLNRFNLPNFSADNLLTIVNNLENLKGLSITVDDDKTGETYRTKIKELYLINEPSDENKENPTVKVFVENEGQKDPYLFRLNEIEFLVDNKEANGLNVVFNINTESDESEIEKTFNDTDEFIKEYGDYLIGKNIVDTKGKKYKITNLKNISEDGDKFEGFITLILNDKIIQFLDTENFEKFINGERIIGEIDSIQGGFSLLLDDDENLEAIEEPKINKPEYKYYLVNKNKNKILTGWEYREDSEKAFDDLFRDEKLEYSILSRRNMPSNLNPDENLNWILSVDNFSIIEEALSYSVNNGDFDEESKNIYIDKYKNEGKYVTVIKANLIYYYSFLTSKFKNSIFNSKFEEAKLINKTISSVMDELLNVIKKDI